MPLVVVDTSVALPATLSPGGLARKFWILLAFGALNYRVEHLRLELDQMSRQASGEGGEVGGEGFLEVLLDRATERRAALAELLPYDIPTDWVAAGSAYVFDEYQRKVRPVAAKLGIDIDEDDAQRLRRQVQAVCVAGPAPFDTAAVPALTPDPADDPIVYAALRMDADLLISDDRHIVPRDAGGSTRYEHGESRVLAVRFDHLMREYLSDIAWDEIEGRWLAEAYRGLGV